MKRRRLRLPEQVLTAREVDTDARPRDGRHRRVEPDPDEDRREQLRRRSVVFVLGGVFLVGCLGALFADGGLLDLVRARRTLAELQRRSIEETARVQRLEDEVARLRDEPTALERIAREELGLARPGEIVFLLPGDEPLKVRPEGERKAP